MAGPDVTDVREVCRRRSDGAAEVLRRRADEFLSTAVLDDDPAVELAASAERALHSALTRADRRDGALDLLVADALVTMALETRAEADPSRLAQFAAALRSGAAPGLEGRR